MHSFKSPTNRPKMFSEFQKISTVKLPEIFYKRVKFKLFYVQYMKGNFDEK